MKTTLKEKDLTNIQTLEPEDESEPCISIPNTEKFDAALDRMIEVFCETSLTADQMIEISKIVGELSREAKMSGFKTGLNFGMLFAQEMEDDEDYVRIDGKYLKI